MQQMGRSLQWRQHRNQDQNSNAGWLTTFNDMITLMMVFFVLLFSLGSMDLKRFKHFQNALQSAMGVLYEGRSAPIKPVGDESLPETSPSGDADRQQQENTLQSLSDTEGLEAQYTSRGLELILNDQLLFHSGSARLTPDGLNMLAKIGKVIQPLNRYIRVDGHTDNVPISTARYPSNWELSTARAIAVVKYFIEQGGIAPQMLSAAGYGAARPRFANDSPAHRTGNRRVEILILHSPTQTAEPIKP